jgi:hypothetical protein
MVQTSGPHAREISMRAPEPFAVAAPQVWWAFEEGCRTAAVDCETVNNVP